MPPPKMRNGGPPQAPAANLVSANQQDNQHPQRTAGHRVGPPIPVTLGELHGPAGRRRMSVLIVRFSPGCGHLHLHRVATSGRSGGYERTGSCGTEYLVLVA